MQIATQQPEYLLIKESSIENVIDLMRSAGLEHHKPGIDGQYLEWGVKIRE